MKSAEGIWRKGFGEESIWRRASEGQTITMPSQLIKTLINKKNPTKITHQKIKTKMQPKNQTIMQRMINHLLFVSSLIAGLLLCLSALLKFERAQLHSHKTSVNPDVSPPPSAGLGDTEQCPQARNKPTKTGNFLKSQIPPVSVVREHLTGA